MTTELKNKWAELYAIWEDNRDTLEEYNTTSLDDLPQSVIDDLFYSISGCDILARNLHLVDYYKLKLNDFIAASGLRDNTYPMGKILNSLIMHGLSISKIIELLIYTVFYNLPELFNKLINEINTYIIYDCNLRNRLGLRLSFDYFTKEEVKEFLKPIIKRIANEPDFEEIYNTMVLPYRLK